MDKCHSHDLDYVRAHGLELLGTCVGSVAARRAFLRRKVDLERTKFARLSSLPAQFALLLLTSSFHLDLAHLLRSLDPEGLADILQDLDDLSYATFCNIRGSGSPNFKFVPHPFADKELVTLPARLGGIGLLSFVERSPHARAAAAAASDVLLSSFMPDISAPSDVRRQKERCEVAFIARRIALLQRLLPEEMARVHENAALLARSHLRVIPYHARLQVRDVMVSLNLHLRCLSRPLYDTCTLCTVSSSAHPSTHIEQCIKVNRTARHEHGKFALARALGTAPATTTTPEPPAPANPGVFNDLRVLGGPGSPFGDHDIDISIVSITTQASRHKYAACTKQSSPGDPSAGPLSVARGILEKAALFKLARQVHKDRTLPPDAPAFVPFIISSGGLLHDAGEEYLRKLKLKLKPHVYSNLVAELSISLLHGRERC